MILIRQLKKKCSSLFFDLKDYRKTVFLAGAGRSGTTWLQEILNYGNDFRLMFEPFHPYKVNLIKEWNCMQYIRVDNIDGKYLLPAHTILSGSVRHEWIDQFNKKTIARKRLIKDIRANLFLKWIKINFPEIPIIFLLRHPCAVANSKLNLGWGDDRLGDLLKQKELMCDFLNPYKKEIEGVTDIFARHIFIWCIENYVPLSLFNEGEMLVVFYETLCQEPRSEASRIFSFLGHRIPENLMEIASIPSRLSRKDSAINSGQDSVSLWKKNITDKQIKQALEILSIFGLEKVYGYHDLPITTGKEVLSLFHIR